MREILSINPNKFSLIIVGVSVMLIKNPTRCDKIISYALIVGITNFSGQNYCWLFRKTV
jgi:uncharacterized membrane protein YgdD (TMEM256/DUF423 family)